MKMLIPAAAATAVLLLTLSACGPMPPGTGPTPVVQGANGPAAPDALSGNGMGVGGANGGMGNGGGVTAGGGPNVP
jgi:hypothetical protein